MLNIYDDPFEGALMAFIAHKLTGDDLSRVENPNQKVHQLGYAYYAEKYKHEPLGKGTKGMRYFCEQVLPLCSGCVSFAYADGRLGLGVASEAERFIDEGLPSLLIEPTREVTDEELSRFMADPAKSDLFHIREFTGGEVALIRNVDPKVGNKLVIPHVETRLRTWLVYSKEKRPYLTAHNASTQVYEGFDPDKK